jgi:hypothetical protein
MYHFAVANNAMILIESAALSGQLISATYSECLTWKVVSVPDNEQPTVFAFPAAFL